MPTKIKRFNKWRSERGDTITEVLISIVILVVVLTAAYALSTHSLSSGVDAQKRSQALSIANDQVSQLVNAQNGLSSGLSKYQLAVPFCINSDGSTTTASHTGDNSAKVCNPDADGYARGISYNGSTGVFTVTTQWPRTSAQNDNQVLLYYKSSSFVILPPSVQLNANPPSVANGGSSTLTWTTANEPTSCEASGDWSGAKSTTGGSEARGPLSGPQVYTYVLTCYRGPASAGAIVQVVAGSTGGGPAGGEDVCPNIPLIQTEVPSGMYKDSSGNCVDPPSHAPICQIYNADAPTGTCQYGHTGGQWGGDGANNACPRTLSDWNYAGTGSTAAYGANCAPGTVILPPLNSTCAQHDPTKPLGDWPDNCRAPTDSECPWPLLGSFPDQCVDPPTVPDSPDQPPPAPADCYHYAELCNNPIPPPTPPPPRTVVDSYCSSGSPSHVWLIWSDGVRERTGAICD